MNEQFSGIFVHSIGSFRMLWITLAYLFLVSVLLEIDVSGGIANITTENFGHSGYLPSYSRSSSYSECQIYNENRTTCTYVAAPHRSDEDVSVMRAWIAVTIRDNIIRLLSAMIHKLGDDLPEDIYTSLHFLYQGALTHRLQTMEMLPKLNPMSKMKRPAQVLELFKALHNAVSPHSKCAVNELISTLSKRKEVLETMSNMMDTNRIDIFEDIGADIIFRLQYTNRTVKVNKRLKAVHGNEFARFFMNIQRGRLNFTQPVFAALLLNMRFAHLTAEDSEDLRYLADNLRYGTIKTWNSSGLCCDGVEDPYDLVRKTLTSLSNTNEIDQKIRDVIETLRRKLVKPGNASVNPYCTEMRNILSAKEMNNTMLLEILMHANETALGELITNGTLNTSYALKGFIPSLYDSPVELVLAFMRRVKHRVPMDVGMEKFISETTSRLRMKSISDSMDEFNKIHNCTEKNNMTDATKTKEKRSADVNAALKHGKFMRCLNHLVDHVKNFLIRNNVITRSTCEDVPEQSSLSSWIQSLNAPATILELSPELVKNASEILARTFADDDVLLELWRRFTETNKHRVHTSNDDEAKKLKNGTRLIDTRKDQLLELFREMLTLTTIRERPLAYHEIIRVYCILDGGCESDTLKRLSVDPKLDDRPHESVIENLAGDFVSLPVTQLLEEEQQFRKSLSGIKPEDYSTKRMLLIDLFKRMLTLDMIKSDSRIYDEIVRFLRSIHNLSIRFTDLIKTLTVDSSKETEYVRTIETFLSQPNVLYILGEDFNIGLFRTNSHVMKGLLSKIASSPSIQKDFPDLPVAAQRMIQRIDCSNYGAEAFQPVADVDKEYFYNTYMSIENGLNKVPQVATAFVESLIFCCKERNSL